MNLTELKLKQISEVIEIAESLGLENVARSRKQDLIFAILKNRQKPVTIFMATVFWKFYRMVLVFCVRRAVPIWRVRTIFMCHRVKSDDFL